MTCYVGLDVSLSEISVCVLEEDGRVRFEGRVLAQPEALVHCLVRHGGERLRLLLLTDLQASPRLGRQREEGRPPSRPSATPRATPPRWRTS